jgi:hypothetical protein
VVLHILEEQNFAAIGRQLNVSRATAHRLYRRGITRLGDATLPHQREDAQRPAS